MDTAPLRTATRPLRVVAFFALSGLLALGRLALTPGWLAWPGLAALPAVAGGCGQVRQIAHSHDPPVAEVQRDFDRIRAFGVLRMVTHPHSPGYFIHKGGDAGFEYELLRDFARSWNLELDVVVVPSDSLLVAALERGEADVAAADLEFDPRGAPFASFTLPCNVVRDVLVLPAGDPRSADLTALDGLDVHVHRDTAAWRTLTALREDLGYACRPVAADPALAVEGLVAAVARGEIPATVAPYTLARSVLLSTPGGRIGPTLDAERPVAWMVRRGSPELLSALNVFLKGHFQITADGTRGSAVWGTLHDRYYEDPAQVRGFLAVENRPDLGGRICRYDRLFQACADSAELDWRLVAAIAYEESRFDPQAISPAGALGLMQVMPRAGGPEPARLRDPAGNVRAGVGHLKAVWKGYAALDSLDRWQLSLATYHAGIGNIMRARQRAMSAGLDPNRWEGGVVQGLLLLSQERRGQGRPVFHGTTTIDYVENVLNRYQVYRGVAPADPFRPPARPAVLAATPGFGPLREPAPAAAPVLASVVALR